RNPPSITACTLDPGLDATAAARPELLHGNSPSTLDACVPAIQRPSARSHRMVDNSLITSRIEYSHSSISPLMSALSTHHKANQERSKKNREEQRRSRTRTSDKSSKEAR